MFASIHVKLVDFLPKYYISNTESFWNETGLLIFAGLSESSVYHDWHALNVNVIN